MRESEIFAAARMSAGFVPISRQIDILNTIRACPATNTERIDKLSIYIRNSNLLLSEFGEINAEFLQQHDQGYALAGKLCEYFHNGEIVPLDPEDILREIGVHIREVEWLETPLDALSCWSDSHGPLILLNVAEKKRCSHEYGRRFTLGHELCHLLVDRGHALGLVDVLGGGMPSFIERRANAFAAELLLPRQLAAIEFGNNNEESSAFLFQLRNKYRVPRKTAASQIFNSSATDMMSTSEFNFFKKEVYEGRDEDTGD